MARQSVSTIMGNIASTVNQDPTPPADGSADFNLWLQFINRGIIEWAEAFDWEVLKKPFFPPLVQNQATIPLPLDFKKLAGPVKLYDPSRVGGIDFQEILPERVSMYNPSTEKYVFTAGDISNGMNLIINPTTMTSGASLSIPYYSIPTSLASSSQIPVIPDSEFLVNRTIGYVFEARSDPRYQDQERKARERLLQMIENASVAKYDSYLNPIEVLTPERRSGFRFGRN